MGAPMRRTRSGWLRPRVSGHVAAVHIGSFLRRGNPDPRMSLVGQTRSFGERQLNVRFARKRARLTDFMSKFTGSLRILVWFGPGRRRPLTSCKNVNRNHGHYRLLQQIEKRISPAPREFLAHTDFSRTSIRSRPPGLSMGRGGVAILAPQPLHPDAVSQRDATAAPRRSAQNLDRRNARTKNAARRVPITSE